MGGLISSVTEKTPELIQQGGQVLLDLVQGFSQQLPVWIAAAGDALAAFFQFLGDNAPALIERGANVLGELALGIINAIPGLVAQLPKIISAIVSFLLSSLPQIAESGARLLAELAIGIVGNIPELLSSVLKVRVAILDGLKALIGEIPDIGKNIVEGLWEGITGSAAWLTGKIKEWCGSVLDGVKSFFGIHSPSAVFRDEVGRFMARGIGVGFQREMAGVAAQMQRSIPVPSVRFGGQMDRSGAAYGAQPSTPASYTFYLTTELDGAVLSRKQYQFNAREASLRGPSLVEVPTG